MLEIMPWQLVQKLIKLKYWKKFFLLKDMLNKQKLNQ